jgi:hypothetical protein
VQRPVQAPVAAAVETVRTTLPELAGIGATPARRANADSERSRLGCDQATRIEAALTGPIPRRAMAGCELLLRRTGF